MSAGIWIYNEKICEGHQCIKDCDHCSYADKIFEAEEEYYTEPVKPLYDSAVEQKEKLKKWLERLVK